MSKTTYKIVDVNESNLDDYDLFCHKSRKQGQGYQNKVKWIKERFKEGLRLKLLHVQETKRGWTSRGFVEYIPGEYTWRGIDAPGYMAIHCLWVVGKHKKKGYATKLLEHCLKDAQAQGMHGVAAVATEGNFLAGRKIFVKNGFGKVDEAPFGFELFVKRFSDDSPLPKFNQSVAEEIWKKYPEGFTVFKSVQCPYIVEFIPIIEKVGKELGIPVRIEEIKNSKEAQAIHPIGTLCIILNGEFFSHYPNTEKGFKKQLNKKGIAV
jgi:ribosomal protein S18 acetylase RimI-like enzyme